MAQLLDRFRILRTPGGLAGFPERHDSPHDALEGLSQAGYPRGSA
jgi:hypothetical protein